MAGPPERGPASGHEGSRQPEDLGRGDGRSHHVGWSGAGEVPPRARSRTLWRQSRHGLAFPAGRCRHSGEVPSDRQNLVDQALKGGRSRSNWPSSPVSGGLAGCATRSGQPSRTCSGAVVLLRTAPMRSFTSALRARPSELGSRLPGPAKWPHCNPTVLLHYQAFMLRRRTTSRITELRNHGTGIADILPTLCDTSLLCLEKLLAMPLSVPVGVGRNATSRSPAVRG